MISDNHQAIAEKAVVSAALALYHERENAKWPKWALIDKAQDQFDQACRELLELIKKQP